MLPHWIFPVFFLLALLSCGLPSSAGLFIERPTLSAKITADKEITLSITGNYSAENYPDFDGVNIYIGDDNTSIEKRIIYLSSQEFLPSFSATASENFAANIVLKDEFSYRYTSKAAEQDYLDAGIGTEKNKLLTKKFYPLETYYFQVRAVNNNGTSSAISEVVPAKIPLIIELDNIDLTAKPTLSDFNQINTALSEALEREFDERQLTKKEDLRQVDFKFETILFQINMNNLAEFNFLAGLNEGAPTDQIDMIANSSPASIFDSPTTPNSQGRFSYSGYQPGFSTYPITTNWYYGFILTGDSAESEGQRKDLRIFINSQTSTTLNITLAYYDEAYKIDIDKKQNFN